MKVYHAIHDGKFFLTAAELDLLLKETNGEVAPWSFDQHDREVVLVPAGCPRQVRNLRSCLKVSLDFVSPEAIPVALAMRDEIRELPAEHGARSDDVHARVVLLHATHAALRALQKIQEGGKK